MKLKVISTSETTSAHLKAGLGVQAGLMRSPFDIVNLRNERTTQTDSSRVTFAGPVSAGRGLSLSSRATGGAMKIEGPASNLQTKYDAKAITVQKDDSLVFLGTGMQRQSVEQRIDHTVTCRGASGTIDMQLGNTRIIVPK